MVTVRREVSPAEMDMGEKLLFISAGKETWACTACTEVKKMETISAATRRCLIVFCICDPLYFERLMLVKQTKPTKCGRFRHWLTTTLSTEFGMATNWAVDQCTRIQH